MKARMLAEEVVTLFSLPEALNSLVRQLSVPDPDIAEIGEIIISDPALTARVLQLANGRCDRRKTRIDTVSAAIAVVGRDTLRDLALTTSITSQFNGIPPELIDMSRFWLNSVACGIIARALAFRCHAYHCEPMFVAGLLHKVGRLVFYSLRPDQYREVLAISGQNEDAINRAELKVFGFTHAEVGAELLGIWGLPIRLRTAVANYLAPGEAPCFRRSAALIHVASALACNIEPSVNLEEDAYDRSLGFEKGAWDLLGLPLCNTVSLVLYEAWIQAFEVFGVVRPESA